MGFSHSLVSHVGLPELIYSSRFRNLVLGSDNLFLRHLRDAPSHDLIRVLDQFPVHRSSNLLREKSSHHPRSIDWFLHSELFDCRENSLVAKLSLVVSSEFVLVVIRALGGSDCNERLSQGQAMIHHYGNAHFFHSP